MPTANRNLKEKRKHPGPYEFPRTEHGERICRGEWGKADYLRNSMQYFFTECLNLTNDFSIG